MTDPDPNTTATHYSATGTFVDPEFDLLLRRAIELVDAARPMPLSASSMINKDEVLELLQNCLDRLPEEMRAARWLLKEREDFLKRVHREGDEILVAARSQAEAMVQRTEVVKAAEQRARRMVEEAEASARRLRLETEGLLRHQVGELRECPRADSEHGERGPDPASRRSAGRSRSGLWPRA